MIYISDLREKQRKQNKLKLELKKLISILYEIQLLYFLLVNSFLKIYTF